MSINDPFDGLARRVMQRSKQMEQRAERMVKRSFTAISRSVIMHNPVWSGQSRLNWKAYVDHRMPSIVRTPQFHRGQIIVDPEVAATSATVSITAMQQVAETYKFTISPSSEIPSKKQSKRIQPVSLYLINHIDYVPKLWSGSWPSNPRTLQAELDAGVRVVQQTKLIG